MHSLSQDQKALVAMGVGPDNLKGTLADYFLALEQAGEKGDFDSALKAADVVDRCGRFGEEDIKPDNDPDQFLQSKAAACSVLPMRDPDYAAQVIEDLASRGVEQAIIRQYDRPPKQIALAKHSDEAQEWVGRVSSRLEGLAAIGNVEAARELGQVYMSDGYGMRDLPRAVTFMQQFVRDVSPTDPRRASVQRTIDQLCGTSLPDGVPPCV